MKDPTKKPDGNEPEKQDPPQDSNSAKVVQLQSNQAGHHAGETFKEGRAKELGILDHCAPFKK